MSTQLDKRQTKNVLVVGGAGYIGSVLVRNLVRKGYNIRLLDLLLYGDESIRDLYEHPHFELIKGDFRHVDVVVNCMKNIDAVVHLGAIVKILEAPIDNIEGEIFNVGSNEQNYQISQIGNIVQKLIPHTKVIHQKEAADSRNYYVSFNRIKERLNFIPRKTVRDSVVEIEEAIRSGKISHYNDPKYNNYIFLNSQPGAKIKPLDVIES